MKPIPNNEGLESGEANYKVSSPRANSRYLSRRIPLFLMWAIILICTTIIYIQNQELKSLQENSKRIQLLQEKNDDLISLQEQQTTKIESLQATIERYLNQIKNLNSVQKDIAGVIKGRLPKTEIPLDIICVQPTNERYFYALNCLLLQQGQLDFQLNSQPGEYYVFAQSRQNDPETEFPLTIYYSESKVDKPKSIKLKQGETLNNINPLNNNICNQTKNNRPNYCVDIKDEIFDR